MKIRFLLSLFICLSFLSANSVTLEKINYGDFNSWVIRNIKESSVIGGGTKTLYEIGPNKQINGDNAYVNQGGSPWATSNVMAKVMGITKCSNAVYRDQGASGHNCVKRTTVIEEWKALGMSNMEVLVSGSIFLGKINEPITSTKNPYSKMEMGIPFTKHPACIVFDYRTLVPQNGQNIYSSGFGSKKTVGGKDNAEIFIYRQKRWEDKDGNIFAKRVGTARERFGSSSAGWVNQHQLPIIYGNATNNPNYKSYMNLISKEKSYYARNSKGKMHPVVEVGWADANETPTHVLLMASSGCGTAFTGVVGMTLWLDNIAFGY